MRFVLVLSLVTFPIFSGVVLPTFSDLEVANLGAKNPGCDPEIHVCSDDISG